MSTSIFLTFFIQAYVPFTLIESWVANNTSEGHELLKSCVIRAGVVTITGKYDLKFMLVTFTLNRFAGKVNA